MFTSVEFDSFVEWRFFWEFNKSSSFWFTIVSGQKLDFSNVSALTEEVSDIAIISLERESSNTNFENSLLVIFVFHRFWLRLLFSNWLSSNNRLGADCFLSNNRLFAFVAWWLFRLGNNLCDLFGSRLLFFGFLIRIGFRLNWFLSNWLSSWLFSNWLCFFRWLLRRFNWGFLLDWLLNRWFSLNNWWFNSLLDWLFFLRFFRIRSGLNGLLGNWLLDRWSYFLNFLRLDFRCFFLRLFRGRFRGFLLLNYSFLNWRFNLSSNLFGCFLFTFFLRWFLLCWFFSNGNNLFGRCNLNLSLLGGFFLNNRCVLFFRGFLFDWNLLGNFLLLNFFLLGWFDCNDWNITIWVIIRCLNR